MSKLLENIYRSVNIGLVNELKMISKEMGIDINKVIKLASTKPFGYKPFFLDQVLEVIAYLLIHTIYIGEQKNLVKRQSLLN